VLQIDREREREIVYVKEEIEKGDNVGFLY